DGSGRGCGRGMRDVGVERGVGRRVDRLGRSTEGGRVAVRSGGSPTSRRRTRPGARRALTVLLVVGATALAGCTDEPEEQTPITVTGGPGAAPALVYTAPLLVEEESTEVLWEGAGPELVDGEAVLIDYAAENTLDRTVRSETY